MERLLEQNEIVVIEGGQSPPSAEERGPASEALFESVFCAITGYAILSTDSAGIITSFNRGAERLTGYAAAEMIGRQTPLQLHLAAETTARARSMERETGRPVADYEVYALMAIRDPGEEFQCTYLHKDGTPMPVCLALQPIVAPGEQGNQGGVVTGFVNVAYRVKPRRTAATNLNGQHPHLSEDPQPEGVVEVARDWTVLYGCRRAVELLPTLVFGSLLWAVFPDLLATSAEEPLRDTMERRRPNEYEVLYTPNGLWLRVHVTPSSAGIKLFLQDVTESRQLRDQLERECVLRQKRVEALGHMAGGLAHEISNPLAVIHMLAGELDGIAAQGSTVPSQPIRSACADILKTANRAMAVLRGLKGFAREASNDPLADASIKAILDECMQLQLPRFERHGIQLRVDVPDDLPGVRCREVQICQIINNLLNNAFDAVSASPAATSGGGWVCLQASRKQETVYIDASDCGPGVPDAAKPNLMEPFFTTKEIGGGIGIGLSLSRAIAQDHGGNLVLLDRPGPTCFRLSLPLACGPDVCPQDNPEQGVP